MRAFLRITPLALLVITVLLAGCKAEPAADSGAEKASAEKGEKTPETDKKAAPDAVVEPAPDPAAPVDPSAAESGAKQRPTDFVEGTPKQQEYLRAAMELIGVDEVHLGVVLLISLLETEEASMERLVGLLMLAEVYMGEANYEKGLARLVAARYDFPPTVEVSGTLAEFYMATNKLPEAAVALTEATIIDPDRLDLLAKLAALQAQLDNQDAVKTASEAYELALSRLLAALARPDATPEDLVGLLEPLAEVRDARLIQPLVALMAHEDLAVIGAAVEALVNAGQKAAVGPIRAYIDTEKRPEIKSGIAAALEALVALPEMPHVPEMPIVTAAAPQ